MNPQPIPDAAKAQQAAQLANNAFFHALLRYGRQHDAALVNAITLSEVGR